MCSHSRNDVPSSREYSRNVRQEAPHTRCSLTECNLIVRRKRTRSLPKALCGLCGLCAGRAFALENKGVSSSRTRESPRSSLTLSTTRHGPHGAVPNISLLKRVLTLALPAHRPHRPLCLRKVVVNRVRQAHTCSSNQVDSSTTLDPISLRFHMPKATSVYALTGLFS
jgi:hypothetical protein